jgi:hypothetical protein
MALVTRHASHRVGADARPSLTAVTLCTGAAVTTGSAVGPAGIGAQAGTRVAKADNMALVLRKANHGRLADTNARFAEVRLSARVVVAAEGSVRLRGI